MGVWSDMPSWQVIGILGEEGDASAMRPARKDGDRVPRWARTGTDLGDWSGAGSPDFRAM